MSILSVANITWPYTAAACLRHAVTFSPTRHSRKERALSYAFTHAVYAYKLLWPAKLCYDWGFRCERGVPYSLLIYVALRPFWKRITWVCMYAYELQETTPKEPMKDGKARAT